mmetsp:Transcript_12884/g.32491  ORF Transcript_12884/g.32491 Transcript_12884/m.32491 type:complete len:219 (+) Transcript_12884:167-823(+)
MVLARARLRCHATAAPLWPRLSPAPRVQNCVADELIQAERTSETNRRMMCPEIGTRSIADGSVQGGCAAWAHHGLVRPIIHQVVRVAIASHGLCEESSQVAIVRALLEGQALAIVEVLDHLVLAFQFGTKILDWRGSLQLGKLLKLHALTESFRQLQPRKVALQEVDQQVANGLQVISSAEFGTPASAQARVAERSLDNLSFPVLDVLERSGISKPLG